MIVVYVIAGMCLIANMLTLLNQEAARYVLMCAMVFALLDTIYLAITLI